MTNRFTFPTGVRENRLRHPVALGQSATDTGAVGFRWMSRRWDMSNTVAWGVLSIRPTLATGR